MKKILQINTVVNSGSTGRIAEGIGREAIARDWESYIAFGRNEHSSQSELIIIGTDFDIKLHWLKTRMFDRHGFGSKTPTMNLIKSIKRLKPDIIHLHNIHGYYLNIEILFNFLATVNIPVVWTLHDCWSFTGHCSYFDFVKCEKWKIECYSCPQKREYPRSWLVDNSKQNFHDKQRLFNSVGNLTIVPVSNWLGSLLENSFFKNKPKNLIYNGIDLNQFSPRNNSSLIRRQLGVENCFMLLGVASLWERRKNLTDFIRLSSLINEDTVIVLVGLTNEQLKDIPSNIIGLPRTENIARLADLYSAADIVLNLSDEETFGLTTIEGFACGTPGIVYNCTASPELVTLNTGIIVENGDMQGLVNAIMEIKTKGKKYYAENCINHVTKNFNKDNKYKEYIQLYESLLFPKNMTIICKNSK